MRWLSDKLNGLAEKLGIMFLVIMLMIVSYQVGSRLLISSTPRWSEEVTVVLMVWFGFLGISIGVKEKFHIAISYFVDKLPEKIRNIILLINETFIVAFGFGLTWFGSKLIYETRRSTLPATKWPAYTPYLILPLVGILIIMHSIINLIDLKKDVSNKTNIQGG